MSEVRTIDLTPTNEGYAAIGATFVSALTSDFKPARKEDATALLRAVIGMAFDFGAASAPSQCRTLDAEARALKDALFARIGG
jgi:hypothetical protein